MGLASDVSVVIERLGDIKGLDIKPWENSAKLNMVCYSSETEYNYVD